MRIPRIVLALVVAVPVLAQPARAVPGAPGCRIFPRTSIWHADVSGLPVHPRSQAWIASMGGPGERLHPDFGPSDGPMPYGIPYEVVAGSHPKTTIDFTYADESDPGPYPFDGDTPIESGSDRHAIMLDRDDCVLYELYDARWNGGKPTAGSGAVFDLRSNALRPSGWTSADAAGLSIFAGLLRRDEVAARAVDHAIRVTASCTDRRWLWPARHQAGCRDDRDLPPMGARFRLKASFDLGGFRDDTRAVLRAMKRYGLIVADNGSDWYFTGTAEDGWPVAMLDELKRIPAGAFEAVDVSRLRVRWRSGVVRPNHRFTRVAFNPAGRDVPREFIEIRNRGTTDWNLAGWRVRDAQGNTYRFGTLILRKGAVVRLHTGSGTDSRTDRYWGRARAVWDNDGDTARLLSRTGVVRDRCRFAPPAPARC